VFLIKSFGRLGFDPKSIMELGSLNLSLFIVNFLVSFCGGAIAIFAIYQIKTNMNQAQKRNG